MNTINDYINKTKDHKQIEKVNWNHIIVQVSGGKDSAVLLDYAVKTFGKDKIIAMHCIIDLDWPETRHIVKEQCNQHQVRLIEVQAVDKSGNKKGILDHITSLKKDRKTGELKENQWPDKTNRWCTSLFKQGPSEKWIRNNCKGNILNLTGERREESPDRAKLDYWEVKKSCKVTNQNLNRRLVYYRPLLDMTLAWVWAVIEDNKLIEHPAYALGMSRAGCAICIFSRPNEIKIAANNAPDIVRKMIEAEDKIEHSFRYKRATKKSKAIKISIKDILTNKHLTPDQIEVLNATGPR